jgi:hypothetical protein
MERPSTNPSISINNNLRNNRTDNSTMTTANKIGKVGSQIDSCVKKLLFVVADSIPSTNLMVTSRIFLLDGRRRLPSRGHGRHECCGHGPNQKKQSTTACRTVASTTRDTNEHDITTTAVPTTRTSTTTTTKRMTPITVHAKSYFVFMFEAVFAAAAKP